MRRKTIESAEYCKADITMRARNANNIEMFEINAITQSIWVLFL